MFNYSSGKNNTYDTIQKNERPIVPFQSNVKPSQQSNDTKQHIIEMKRWTGGT